VNQVQIVPGIEENVVEANNFDPICIPVEKEIAFDGALLYD
jgi:hypothetical protein